MRYRVYTRAGVDAVREALSERKTPPDLSKYEAMVGSGDLFQESVLATAAAAIRKAQTGIKKAKLPAEELDRICFDIIHQAIPRDEAMIADMDFWSRFAIKELSDVIYARFPGRRGKFNLDNFGLGSRKECWPYKLWVRGELAFDENTRGKDKYIFGRVGGVEIWTSHVHRQNFMSVRPVFRSVFEFQYPTKMKGKPLLFEGEENPKKGGVPGFRTLIKRLRENWASVEYVCLSENEAADLVKYHSKGLHRADDKSVLKAI